MRGYADFDLTSDQKFFIKKEIGRKCEYCEKSRVYRNLQLHHINPQRKTGRNDYGNLIVLCENTLEECHDLADHDYILKKELRDIISRRPKRVKSKIIEILKNIY